MDAPSREDVFEQLRAKGIKAIKVVAADGSKANGEIRGVRKRVVTGVAVGVALVAGAGAFLIGRGGSSSRPHPQTNETIVVATHIAQPLARQMIPGDRQRLTQAVAALTNAAERALATFAEPGRPLVQTNGTSPTEAEFQAILAIPLRIAEDEFTESIDLKRIVAGIKREMRDYLAGGGTVEDYLAECAKRQKQEIAYRTRADERLYKLLGGPEKESYEYWLKANAQLQAMGIYPLPLPDKLRKYQLSLDIEE